MIKILKSSKRFFSFQRLNILNLDAMNTFGHFDRRQFCQKEITVIDQTIDRDLIRQARHLEAGNRYSLCHTNDEVLSSPPMNQQIRRKRMQRSKKLIIA